MSVFAIISLIGFVVLLLFIFVIAWSGSHHFSRKKEVSAYRYKILVDLSKCKVISSRSEEQAPEGPSISNVTVVSWMNPSLYEQNSHPFNYSSKIVYEEKGKKFYSDTIEKDKITVQYYMLSQPNTYIYLNSPEDYFFDISFISK